MQLSVLWRAPEVNPVNRKARSIPVLNIFNVYARAFHFSWLGFMIAFWAWYTFPPLLTVTIKKDLKLTNAQVANSNIVSLVATLFMRLIAGPACDRFGSRIVFGSLLLVGTLPVGLAPLVTNATGLYISRFFIGILGATFVPCQVWCTGFFDKNVVGTANALAGGWGNAGGGITYLIAPVVYDSFVHARGYSPGQAWRLTFIVPVICLLVCGLGLLLLCEDTPTGKWADRHLHAQENLQSHGVKAVVDVPGGITDRTAGSMASDEEKSSTHGKNGVIAGNEAPLSRTEMVETAQGDTVVNPTFKDAMKVVFSPQTVFHVATYGCSFGGNGANFGLIPHVHGHANGIVSGVTGAGGNFGGIIFAIIFRFMDNGNNYAKGFWIIGCIHIAVNL
ncbi:Nitrate transporter, partial [Colletotrichum shisoi]